MKTISRKQVSLALKMKITQLPEGPEPVANSLKGSIASVRGSSHTNTRMILLFDLASKTVD